MKNRTLVLSLTVIALAGATAFGWVSIRRGFGTRECRIWCRLGGITRCN